MTSMDTNPNEFLWALKYRPRKVADIILPQSIKANLQSYVDGGNVANLMLTGSSGIGKTTAAKAIAEELGADTMFVNASLDGGIDNIRNDIAQFSSTVSIVGEGRKIVILDEADNLTAASQMGMRSFMEEFAVNCAFILTCNFKGKILDAIHSRCVAIDFTIPKAEMKDVVVQFMERIEAILTTEGVEYNRMAVASIIKRYFPDWRRVIGEIQRYSATGSINSGSLAVTGKDDFDQLVAIIKSKKWSEMRKWVATHSDIEPSSILRMFYDEARSVVVPSSIPALVLLIADTQYRLPMSADREICMVAFLTQVMSEIAFN